MNSGDRFQSRLIAAASRLDAGLCGKSLRAESSGGWLEPVYLLAGVLLGTAAFGLPGARSANALTRLCARAHSGRPFPPWDEPSLANLQRAASIFREAQMVSGRRPAVLIAMSHPRTARDELYLFGRLVAFAIDACRSLTPTPRLRYVQAVDDFALDTLPPALKGFYTGVMAAGHIAVDRNPGLSSRFKRRLLRAARYERAMFRILGSLRSGHAVCVALGGAVAHNARILYTAREFAQRIFSQAPLPRGPRRYLEEKIVAVVAQGAQGCALGRLAPPEREQLLAVMAAVGLEAARARALLAEFEEEFARETSYRDRFFKALLSRTAGKGRSILVLPLAHQAEGGVRLHRPALVLSYDRKRGVATFLDNGNAQMKASDWSRAFVRASFK